MAGIRLNVLDIAKNQHDPSAHAPERWWSSLERRSSLGPAFSASAPDAICFEEVFHCGCDFYDMCLYRKMSGIKELNLRVRQVFPERLRSRGNEKGIALAQIARKGGFDLRKYSWNFGYSFTFDA